MRAVILFSFSVWLYNRLELGHFFSFLILYTVGRTPLTGDQPVARPLPTHRTIQTQNKRTQTSIPRVEFLPTIPMLERAKTVHALDRAGTVIASDTIYSEMFYVCMYSGAGRIWPLHRDHHWSIVPHFWINTLSIPHFERTAGRCLWGRHNSHLVPWNTGPGDETANGLYAHSHKGHVWLIVFLWAPFTKGIIRQPQFEQVSL
jgi:hypothetical protein